MIFTFQAGSDEATLSISGSTDLKIGLDNRYRLTELPNSRPVGLRGRWDEPDEFYLDYIIQGDFIESIGRFKFEDSHMAVKITNLNFNSQPVILQGRIMK